VHCGHGLNQEKEPSGEIRKNRGEIWVTVGKRKGFSKLELPAVTAFRKNDRRAALSLGGTGLVLLWSPARRLYKNKKLTQT
jgi:hypothetical protein